jgi:methionyl-tRNA formyltransferase
MKREDGVIDWHMRASDISNRVRGFQPFPTAFTTFRAGKLTIWAAFPVDDEGDSNALPGEIVTAHNDDLRIRCGERSVLNIEEMQPEGKRRMKARDFINGSKPQAGEKLGN